MWRSYIQHSNMYIIPIRLSFYSSWDLCVFSIVYITKRFSYINRRGLIMTLSLILYSFSRYIIFHTTFWYLNFREEVYIFSYQVCFVSQANETCYMILKWEPTAWFNVLNPHKSLLTYFETYTNLYDKILSARASLHEPRVLLWTKVAHTTCLVL